MAATNFEACLAETLKWEGGYSNHPDDPGGPTMRGIIQREYNAWRAKRGLPMQPVIRISEDEVQAIYRAEYWDAMGCDGLPLGFDLVVFDAAVNNGVGRARQWLLHDAAHDIDVFCNARLAFDQSLGRLWRVFGAGWRRRVEGLRAHAKAMAAGKPARDTSWLQSSLNKLGANPALAVDDVEGPLTRAAVAHFQGSHGLLVTGSADEQTIAAVGAALSLTI